jgi:hypothetical protein
MCTLRNALAHGNIVPSQFVGTAPERAIASANVKSYADVLREASAVLLRGALLKIFRMKMVDRFSDKKSMEALFCGQLSGRGAQSRSQVRGQVIGTTARARLSKTAEDLSPGGGLAGRGPQVTRPVFRRRVCEIVNG